jgi:hypothetical protein
MSNGKNVLIPIPLVKQIIELFGYWDTSKYDRFIRDDCEEILQFLNVKLQKLELRDAYGKIVAAKNDDDRHDARIGYLCQKQRLKDLQTDGCIF